MLCAPFFDVVALRQISSVIRHEILCDPLYSQIIDRRWSTVPSVAPCTVLISAVTSASEVWPFVKHLRRYDGFKPPSMTDVLCGNHCSRCPICRKNFRIWLSGKTLRRREKSKCFCCRASVLLSQGPVATGSFLHGAQPFYGSDDQSMRFTCTLLTHGRQAKKSWYIESQNT